MNETLTEDDEGKRVVGPDGETLGTVEKVDQGVAHVDLDAGDERANRYLNREDAETPDDAFQETAIAESAGDEIVLRADD